jgi:hypothetical protein
MDIELIACALLDAALGGLSEILWKEGNEGKTKNEQEKRQRNK